jgi:arylsulfatase A-like enzyme
MQQPFLVISLLTILAGALPLFTAASPSSSTPPQPPNILFLLSDDLGYAELSSFGQSHFSTPHIDSLASDGIRFTNAYAGAPVCGPSRSVLMTGLHTGHNYIRGNNGQPDGTDMGLRANDTTVAELLQKQGYHTSLLGKWGLGYNGTDGQPNLKGFDQFYGELDQANAHNMYPHFLWNNTVEQELTGNTRLLMPPSRHRCMSESGGGCNWTHDFFTNAAVDALHERAGEPDKPFFMVVSWTDPHAGGYTRTNLETGNPVPSAKEFADVSDWPDVEQDHASVIQNYQDRDVGTLLALLDDLNLADNTIVFFASDNGASNEGGEHSYQFFNSSGPLTGCKRSLYEGGIRSPIIARWPGVIKPGVVSDFPWYFADFLPTALDLAGADPAEGVDGMSILPVLRGDAIEGASERCLYFEFCTNINGRRSWGHAARIGDMKAVSLSGGMDAELELYDLSVDAGEKNNLRGADGYEDVLAKLQSCLVEEHEDSPDFPVGDDNCKSS